MVHGFGQPSNPCHMLCSIPRLHVSLPHWSQGWVCAAVRAWSPWPEWMQQQCYRLWLLKHTVCQNPSLSNFVFNPQLWPAVSSNHAIGSPNSVAPKCVESAGQKIVARKLTVLSWGNLVSERPLAGATCKETKTVNVPNIFSVETSVTKRAWGRSYKNQ